MVTARRGKETLVCQGVKKEHTKEASKIVRERVLTRPGMKRFTARLAWRKFKIHCFLEGKPLHLGPKDAVLTTCKKFGQVLPAGRDVTETHVSNSPAYTRFYERNLEASCLRKKWTQSAQEPFVQCLQFLRPSIHKYLRAQVRKKQHLPVVVSKTRDQDRCYLLGTCQRDWDESPTTVS